MVDEKKEFFLPQVRVSQEVYSWLQAKAAGERRSMTQQLLWELEKLTKENNTNGSPE
jgi:hypothetical protein